MGRSLAASASLADRDHASQQPNGDERKRQRQADPIERKHRRGPSLPEKARRAPERSHTPRPRETLRVWPGVSSASTSQGLKGQSARCPGTFHRANASRPQREPHRRNPNQVTGLHWFDDERPWTSLRLEDNSTLLARAKSSLRGLRRLAAREGGAGQSGGIDSPRMRSSKVWRRRTRCGCPSRRSTSAAKGLEL